MPRAYHEIHAQEGGQCQNVKFPALEFRVFAAQPVVRLEENDQRPDCQYAFYYIEYRVVDEHPSEYLPGLSVRIYRAGDEQDHQHAHYRMEMAAAAFPGYQIIQESEYDRYDERDFRMHVCEYV